MWERLPELILIKVFSHLNGPDRASAAQVCRHWAQCLASPCLWRKCVVHIDRDLSIDYSIVSELAIKYGEHMRSLELAWSRPYIMPREPRVQAEAGADFLTVVRAKDVQLKELILTDWIFSSKWSNCRKLFCSLANLLACQQNLEKFSLLNANFSLTDVIRLLAIVTKTCGTRLAMLDLRGAFREWQAPHYHSRYLRLLGRMHALAHLSLDYPALSNGALNALAAGAPKVLRTLHISVRDSDSRQHRIDDSSWHNLVTACPDLTVSYTIGNISHHEDMSYLLLPSVPLAKFHMLGGHVWDQSRTRNFRGTVGLLINHYTDTLAEVMLQLRNNREMLDDLIVSMLTRCKHLKKLQYDGIMRNLETLRDICQLQTENKIYFQAIHVKPRNVNLRNRAILHEINHQYDQKMMNQGIDFRIENPA